MRESKMSPGAAAACGRLDALVHTAGDDLGRWMIELAERLAAKGRSRRTLEAEGEAGEPEVGR